MSLLNVHLETRKSVNVYFKTIKFEGPPK